MATSDRLIRESSCLVILSPLRLIAPSGEIALISRSYSSPSGSCIFCVCYHHFLPRSNTFLYSNLTLAMASNPTPNAVLSFFFLPLSPLFSRLFCEWKVNCFRATFLLSFSPPLFLGFLLLSCVFFPVCLVWATHVKRLPRNLYLFFLTVFFQSPTRHNVPFSSRPASFSASRSDFFNPDSEFFPALWFYTQSFVLLISLFF